MAMSWPFSSESGLKKRVEDAFAVVIEGICIVQGLDSVMCTLFSMMVKVLVWTKAIRYSSKLRGTSMLYWDENLYC